jgi:hypothetical protein
VALSRDGLWRSLVSALDWGSRGREFKSPQPDALNRDGGEVSDSPTVRWSQNGHKKFRSGILSTAIEVTDELRGASIVSRNDVCVDLLHHPRRVAETRRHHFDRDARR